MGAGQREPGKRSLRKTIIDIVYEGVPVVNSCPICEKGSVENFLGDPKSAASNYDRLVDEILEEIRSRTINEVFSEN